MRTNTGEQNIVFRCCIKSLSPFTQSGLIFSPKVICKDVSSKKCVGFLGGPGCSTGHKEEEAKVTQKINMETISD
jgi:hypothetical protein